METDDDAELVRRARLRDQQAFARLYRRHIGRVHALCRRMTGDLLALAFYPGMPPRRTDSAA